MNHEHTAYHGPVDIDDQDAEVGGCSRLEDEFMTWGSLSALVVVVAVLAWAFWS